MNILTKFFFTLIMAILYFGPIEISTQQVNDSASLLVCSLSVDNCETCVRDAACFWCESKLLCKVYDAENKVETKQCGEWKWKNCKVIEASPTTVIISASVSVGLIFVLLVFICIKRDVWNRLRNSRFCDRWDRCDREGLFEQEERLKRERKHRKAQSSKAQQFAEKYQLNDSDIPLYQSS